MERLHSFFIHVNDLTPYQLHSRAGVQMLCDLLLMPGLPFDFPVSFSCATFCKSVDQLLNYMSVEDVVEPILEVRLHCHVLITLESFFVKRKLRITQLVMHILRASLA